MQRPTHAEVDLGVIRHNINAIRANLPNGVKFMAIVKANAYGHGIYHVASTAISAGAEYLGVAIPDEGTLLREQGITAPILILGGITPAEFEETIKYGLSVTMFSPTQLIELNECAKKLNRTVNIHIKYDTGMNRIGIKTLEELSDFLNILKNCERLKLEGMFTHFAVSELEDTSFTLAQNKRFNDAADLLSKLGYGAIMLHTSNSGATLSLPDSLSYDMVRCGIAIYGYRPAPTCGVSVDIRPTLSFKTSITQVKEIYPSETVGYGRRYTASEKRLVATLPVGYGDGYRRNMSGKAEVLIGGKRAPILGSICMDQCMADITCIQNVNVGDEVVLIGAQGEGYIGADELAEWANTISYEIILGISPRVPRIYLNM